MEIIFEAKTVSAFRQNNGNTEIPMIYVQRQHYMAVTGFNNAYIAALIGGNKFVYRLIERDDELIDMIIQLEYNFWNCVENNVPPDVDGSDACTELMGRLYPSSNRSCIVFPDEAKALINQFNSSKEQEKHFAELKDEASNKLKNMLGDNDRILGDITVSWKNVTTDRLNSKKQSEVPEIYKII